MNGQSLPTVSRVRAGFGMMTAAILLLCTPHVNVIDITPDCLAWCLMALSMTTLSYVNDEIAAARRMAWLLCGITAVKLLPMYFSVRGAAVFPLVAEPTMVLVYTLCFGAAECLVGAYIVRKWLAAIAQIGLYRNSVVTICGIDTLRLMTALFFFVRYLFSFIPELVYLRSTEYLGNVVYGVVIDIRDYRPYLIVIGAWCALVFGIAWVYAMLRYLRRLKHERDADGNPLISAALDVLFRENEASVQCKNKLERFTVAFGLMLVGAVFLCHLSVENVNVLPDFVGVALLLAGLALLKPFCEIPRYTFPLGIATAVLCVPYYAVRTRHGVNHHIFWAKNLLDYFRRNVTLSPQKQAETMGLQLWMLLLAVLETALLIAVFVFFIRALRSLNKMTVSDGITLYDSMTHDMMRAEKEKFARQPKKVFVWFCISCGMEILRALPMFAFVVTPIAMVRVVINVIFVCVFAEYLGALRKVVVYHFRYNSPNAST